MVDLRVLFGGVPVPGGLAKPEPVRGAPAAASCRLIHGPEWHGTDGGGKFSMLFLVALAIGLGAFGLVLLGVAWWSAGHANTPQVNPAQAHTPGLNRDRAQLLGTLATGILTGALVTVVVVLLQQQLAALSENAVWRANVATAADIPGFTPAGHSLLGLNLSGKQLPDANLRGANLTGVQLRDTNLSGAILRDANLHDAVMYSADLSTADLTGANLSGARLQGVRFDRAVLKHIKSFTGAVANAATCWPHGFLELPIAKEIKAVPYYNRQWHAELSRGHEYPGCLYTR